MRFNDDRRRASTIVRDNDVHEAYDDVKRQLGDYVNLVPKSYIYDLVKHRTKLCTKTIAYILNHTKKYYPNLEQ